MSLLGVLSAGSPTTTTFHPALAQQVRAQKGTFGVEAATRLREWHQKPASAAPFPELAWTLWLGCRSRSVIVGLSVCLAYRSTSKCLLCPEPARFRVPWQVEKKQESSSVVLGSQTAAS